MREGTNTVHILYATGTGTAEDVAQEVAELLNARGVTIASCCSIDGYELSKLLTHAASGQYFIFVVATCGDGEVPPTMRKFWHFIRRLDLPAGVLSDLRFAVFGLGDRAYVKFNAAARKLALRLIDLGAQAILPIALGDESAPGSYDAELVPWTEELVGLFAEISLHSRQDKNAKRVKEPRVAVEAVKVSTQESSQGPGDTWELGQAVYPLKSAWHPHGSDSGSGLFEAHVLANTVLTDSKFLTDDREVRHLELDVAGAAGETGLLSYVPGDVVHVMPRNTKSSVDAFFKLTGFDKELLVNIKPSGSKTRFGSYQLNLKVPCRLRDFVSSQLDLSSIPRRKLFERLAPFATDPMQKEKLLEFTAADGAEVLTQYAYREKRTILMVLRDFPSARPPLDHLIDMIPVLKSRPFSIASSTQGHPDRIHICASIVKYTTPLRFSRVGVCSAFFLRLHPGDIIPVFLEKGTSLRFNENKPSIMVGPGTGVAPMRSFISSVQHRSAQRILFFGCRSKRGDYLYEKDWEAYLHEETLTGVFTAFSREAKGEKTYVQKRLRENDTSVWRLLSQEDAIVYIAGSSGAMPKGVRQALVDVCETAGSLGAEEAEEFVRLLEANGRLQMECW